MNLICADPQYRALRTELFRHLPGVKAWYTQNSGKTLLRCAEEHIATGKAPSVCIQRILTEEARRLLGDTAAEAFARYLAECPSVLVPHHHGILCHPEFLQSAMFFRPPPASSLQPPVVPVLACSTVAMRSYSYPRGLLLGRQDATGRQVRLPLFPESTGDSMVRLMPAFSPATLKTAMRGWEKLSITDAEMQAAKEMMALYPPDVPQSADDPTTTKGTPVCAAMSFTDQASRINAAIWHTLLPGTELIFLDLETITSLALLHDLADENSLMHHLLCHENMRTPLLAALSGKTGCWEKRTAHGTCFFWAHTPAGRRVALFFDEDAKCLKGSGMSFSLDPEALQEALRQGTLHPSVFTSCTCLCLGHGLKFFGGMYMVDYLRDIALVIDALCQQHQVRNLIFHETLEEAWGLGSAYMPLQHVHSGYYPVSTLEYFSRQTQYSALLPKIWKQSTKNIFPFTVPVWYAECVPQKTWPSTTGNTMQRILQTSHEFLCS